jgi:hypothetical protein
MYRHAFHKSPRCQFRTPSGKRCRFNASSSDSTFCEAHSGLAENHRQADDLSATLTAGLTQFKSPAELNDFLTRLLLLLAQDRISARRAAVLAYITNQLLRTISAIESAAEKNDEPTKIEYVFNIPRPNHEDPPTTAPAAAENPRPL